MMVRLHCVSKTPQNYFLNNSAKNEPTLKFFDAQNSEKLLHKKVANMSTLPVKYSYTVSGNSSNLLSHASAAIQHGG